MARTVVVFKDSPVLRDPSTRVLNQYSNGTALVTTDAPVLEAGESHEMSAGSGLKLPGVAETARARAERSAPRLADARTVSVDDLEAIVSSYVEFIGPPDKHWLDQLSGLGIGVLTYQPENSYLCNGPRSAFARALQRVETSAGVPAIRQVTELTPDLKTRSDKLPEVGPAEVVVIVMGTPATRGSIVRDLAAVPDVEIVEGHGNDVFDVDRLRIRARIRGAGQENLLRLPSVLSVENFQLPTPEDEVAGLICAGLYTANYQPSGSYVGWLRDHGVDGRGVAIGVVDAGVDISHPAFAGRARDLAGGQKDWHATMVAGHAAGNYLAETDPNRFIYGLGIAPAAEILSQDKMQSASFLCRQTVIEAGTAAAIQNNSWGKGTKDPMDYGSDEALYDSMVRNADPQGAKALPLTICFSSGNGGSLGLTRPKAAKNVIITGNSESFRPEIGHDASDNIREVYAGAHGSSYGNCGDGRIRPHVVAPGEWTASANYDCHPGEDEFISPMLTWGGGSSGASPKTAGACALLIHWWQTHHDGATPSPAMLRALVVHGAEPILTGGPVPNNRQGWGRLNLQNIMDPAVARITIDQSISLSQPGETREWTVRAVDPSRPVRITLAWTDPPGAVGSGSSAELTPIVNKLALRAQTGKTMFRGMHDRFRNGWSASEDAIAKEGGSLTLVEGSDNLQNIFLSTASVTGAIRVSVTALNITTNCLTGKFDHPQQDFSLVLSNGQLDAGASPSSIVVGVDPASNGSPASSDSTGHWSVGDGNDDAHLTPATPVEPTTSPKAVSAQSTLASPDIDDAWWDDDGNASTTDLESARGAMSEPQTRQSELARGLGVAFRTLEASGHNVVTAQASTALTPISATIAAIKDRLAQPRQGPLTSVIVIGAGTRFTLNDIRALRSFGSAITLFLVSVDPAVLAFLAHRLGNRPGVRYRLAQDSSELPALLIDTLAEAGGLQRIVATAPTQRRLGNGCAWTFSFDVTTNDRVVVMDVHEPSTGVFEQIKLNRPNAPDMYWTPSNPTIGQPGTLSVQWNEGCLKISDTGSASFAGLWSIEVVVAGTTDATDVPILSAWALGGPAIVVHDNEVGTSDDKRLLKISGEAGVTFSKASISPARWVLAATAESTIAGESDKDIVMQNLRSRLDRHGQVRAEDDRRPIAVPVLGQVLTVAGPTAGSSVMDLPIAVWGIDAKGHRFARRIRTNVSRWRPLVIPRDGTESKIRHVRGQIAQAQFRSGRVVALRLIRNARSRWVDVVSPGLAQQLAEFRFDELRGRTFTFGLHGGELCEIFLSLLDASPRPSLPDDRGIDNRMIEVVRPRAESDTTDYPDATRFVRAASFRKGGDMRSVNRVVIHITDGGSSIEGPISWFQNPASGVSAHYVVGQNGEVVQMVRDADIAWHANSANADSIGIEHCARSAKAQGHDDPGLMPTPLQYEASGALVRWLCETYDIPLDRDHILGHSEADPKTTHRGCPNAVWDWDYYMDMLIAGASLPPPEQESSGPGRRLLACCEGATHR